MIVNFTKKLQEALGVDDEILDDMVLDNFSAEYGEFLLVANCRCFNSGWKNVIEVVPTYLGDKHGYANTDSLENGAGGWHYIMQGTKTECLPPIEVQHKIIALIKSDNEKYAELSPDNEKIAELEVKKDLAIENEDYEKAAEIKNQIDKLKNK